MDRLGLLAKYVGSAFASDAITDVNVNSVAQALVEVEEKIYEAKHPNITFQDIFPVKNLNNSTVTNFRYYYVTGAGKAELQNGDGKISFVDGMIKAKNVPLFDGAVGYKYTTKELKRANDMGVPLDDFKGKVAFRSVLELAQDICFNGDESRDIVGFFNNDAIASITPIGGTAWSTKEAPDILEDITHLFTTAWTQTKEVHFKQNNPNNRLMLSTSRYASLLKPLGDNKDKTILKYIVENLPFISSVDHIISSPELPEDSMRIFEKDEDKICFYWGHLPEWGTPSYADLTMSVPAEYSIGGLVIREPLSVWEMQGI